jgi:hypothetical protein
MAALQGGLEDEEERGLYVGAGGTVRSLSDSGIDFHTRMALLSGRYTMKRKRPGKTCYCSNQKLIVIPLDRIKTTI